MHHWAMQDRSEGRNEVWVVMPLYKQTLANGLAAAGQVCEQTAAQLMKQLCAALAHCRSRRVINRDVKPTNILCNGDMTDLVLCDFANAAILSKGETWLYEPGMVTPVYRAPELWAMRPYGYGVDVWAAACVWAEMLLGRPLIKVSPELRGKCQKDCEFALMVQTQHVQQELHAELGSFRPYGRMMSQQGLRLMAGMLEVSPSHRMNAADVALQLSSTHDLPE